MIPVLYDKNETAFDHQGIGPLTDMVRPAVEEGVNGAFEFSFQYPENGIHREELVEDNIILAKPGDGRTAQPFRIYKSIKQTNGMIQVNAEHLAYQTNYIQVMPFTANNCASAVGGLKYHAVGPCPFTLITDISASGEYTQDRPEPLRQRLMGGSGSILETYGGELEFDWYTIRLKTHRGVDNGATLRYGKNIIDLRQEKAIDSVYTAILPYVSSDDDDRSLITLPEKYIAAETAGLYPYIRIKSIDFGDEFGEDEPKTVSALRQKANAYIQNNSIGYPVVSITLNIAALWQTEEYAQFAAFERIGLGDIVTVIYERLGIELKAEVIRTVYDPVNERYTSIEIGQSKATVSSIISDRTHKLADQMTSTMDRAIQHATELITGGLGGCVVLKRNANGRPEEILIMDTEDISTATNVWRWNINGWGHSSSGYEGPYTMAATLDGGFVADFITTGTLDASNVNVINLNASNINTGTLNASLIKTGTLDASKITVKNLSASSINTGQLSASFIKTGTLDCRQFTVNYLSATSITSGTLNCSRITVENLSASSITSGTMRADRISGGELNFSTITVRNLSASSITSGTLDCSKVTVKDLSANKITTGTMSADRISTGSMSAIEKIGFDRGAWLDQKEIDDKEYVLKCHNRRFKSYGALISDGNTRPTGDGSYNCGTSGHRWSQVFSKKAEINTSDIKAKHDINPISEKYEELFLGIEPVTYELNGGDRVHIGAIAQQVKEVMDNVGLSAMDVAAYCQAQHIDSVEYINPEGIKVCEDIPAYDEHGNPIYDYALRYGEFVMLNMHMIQRLYRRVEELEQRLQELDNQE